MGRIFDNDITWLLIMGGLVIMTFIIMSSWKEIESERVAPQMAAQGYEQARDKDSGFFFWKKTERLQPEQQK
jgi:hypothetical protein